MAAICFSRAASLRWKASSIGLRKASHSFCSSLRSKGTAWARPCHSCCRLRTASMRSTSAAPRTVACSIKAWRCAKLVACAASNGARALLIAAFHNGCNSANCFSPRWPPLRQASAKRCSSRACAFQSVLLACCSAQVSSSFTSASRCARWAADSALSFSSHCSTTLWAWLQASSKRFHSAWLGGPPWSVCFQASRRARRLSWIFLPPGRCDSGPAIRASALPTNSWRNWSARQRCQPSKSPAWANSAWALASNSGLNQRACSFKAWRNSVASLGRVLPCPCSSSVASCLTAASTLSVACALAWAVSSAESSGWFLSGTASPRCLRISSAHTGTAGSAAELSAMASTACCKAASKACHTSVSCARELSSMGA